MRFIVLTTAYNCSDWILDCINSIQSQTYKNFVCFILDDMSTDNTTYLAKNAVKGDSRFIINKNKRKYFQTGNYDKIIRSNLINEEDVIIEVDGDDYLPDNNVFQRIAYEYQNSSIWLTYGQFRYLDGKEGISRELEKNINVRTSNFCFSHLRTWKAFLWRNIKPSDLLHSNAWYPESAGDVFFMLPMIEMATRNHIKFISEINYVYNNQNPLNDNKLSLEDQNLFANYARSKKPYTPLSTIN